MEKLKTVTNTSSKSIKLGTHNGSTQIVALYHNKLVPVYGGTHSIEALPFGKVSAFIP